MSGIHDLGIYYFITLPKTKVKKTKILRHLIINSDHNILVL